MGADGSYSDESAWTNGWVCYDQDPRIIRPPEQDACPVLATTNGLVQAGTRVRKHYMADT